MAIRYRHKAQPREAVSLTMPVSMKEQVWKLAGTEGLTITAWVRRLIIREIARQSREQSAA